MRPTIQNRDFQLPTDDWYQIEVSGEHPNRAAGLVQVIDNRAIDSIVENFTPGESGILIDAEHFSHDPDKPTTAYGWLMEVKNCDGQLHGKIRWTNTGRPAVEGGDLRFFSTEYSASGCEKLGSNKVRPLRLDGLTLTNRPNNKGGKPISNRDSTTDNPSGDGNAAGAQTQQTKPMTNIAKALGLAEDATEEDILAAITKLKDDSSTEKGRADKLETELKNVRNREADALIEEHKAKIGDNEDTIAFWRDGLIENREQTEKALIALPQPGKQEEAQPPRLHNRSSAKSPAPVSSAEGDDKHAKQQQLVEDIRLKNRCSHTDAWNQAKRQSPELF